MTRIKYDRWRGWAAVAGLVVALSLSGLGFLAWHQHGAVAPGPQPVVWLTGYAGTLRGRVDPGLEISMVATTCQMTVRLRSTSERNWLGLPVLGQKTTYTWESEAGPAADPFVMMDERDQIYLGSGSGKIEHWDGTRFRPGRGVVTGAERARVAAMYLQKTGKAWPEPQEQAR